MKEIPVANTLAELRGGIATWRMARQRIGLVPTMGALHRGHLALVEEAKKRADKVVVSIFVNPAQFAPHEDFDRYPRTFDADLTKLAEAGHADAIYAPSVSEMYPEGFATRINVGGPSAGLETDFRPHFFGGVATVVSKLFLQCLPDSAVFGEKDYQQLQVVKRMVRDLDLPIEIIGAATIREDDGLALSSRNAYLNAAQRQIAAQLNKILRLAAKRARDGVPVPQAEAEAQAALLNAGFDKVDYVAIRDARSLQQLDTLNDEARILAAAWLDKTRLIDNMPV